MDSTKRSPENYKRFSLPPVANYSYDITKKPSDIDTQINNGKGWYIPALRKETAKEELKTRLSQLRNIPDYVDSKLERLQ